MSRSVVCAGIRETRERTSEGSNGHQGAGA